MEKTEHQAVGEMYKPNHEVQESLARITLVQIIGPTAVGKSTLINKITSYESGNGPKRLSEVGTITTRDRRDDDSKNVTNITMNEMENRINNGDLVQYFKHPSGDIYATDIGSYETEVCLLPTMASSANDFLGLGFENIIRIGILLDGKQWEKRLLERQAEESFGQRLVEAMHSLHVMRNMYRPRNKDDNENEPKLLFVENNDGQIDEASEIVFDVINGKFPADKRPRFNTRSLEMAAIIEGLQRQVAQNN